MVRGTLSLVLAAGLAGTSACTGLEGEGPSYLIIASLEAISGATDETTGNNLQSDVITKGSFFEDEGLVAFSLGMKDAQMTFPNTANAITVDRFRVVYFRTDGRNTPGVDVPFGFDGAFTVTVRAGETTEATFSLVRPQAKAEAPLLALRNGGGNSIISVIAEITFYGRDQAGNKVSAVGRISIDFADFGDPE